MESSTSTSGTSLSSPELPDPRAAGEAGSVRISILHQPLVVAGGAERQALEEARTLSTLGHEITVLTFRLSEDALLPNSLGAARIEVLRGGNVARRVRSLRRALLRGSDLLVSHSSPELAWLATRGTTLPYVVYHNSPPFYRNVDANPCMAARRYRRGLAELNGAVAGHEEFANAARPGPGRRAASEARTWLKHRALRDAEAVVVLSERTRHELRVLHGIDAVVVRGCLPSEIVESPPARRGSGGDGSTRGPGILSVSRLEAVKRIDLLIRAFARIQGSMPASELVVAGAGPERERLSALAEELGVSARVHFPGFLSEADLWSHYAAADIFAAPTVADFNVAPYEALAMGCKVVWTTAMETDPAIEASGRVFVAEPDERSFAAALVEADRSTEGRRPDLRELTWEARARRVDRLYRACLRDVDR